MSRTIELLRLIQICRQIDGRKKLQKIVHILKEAGHPFNYRYAFHFHGPFSAELKGEIDSLVGKLLSEEQVQTGDYQQFVYKPTPALIELLDRTGPAAVPDWAGLAERLNQKSAGELEAISTTLYLRRHGFDGEALQTRFRQLKPKLEPHLASSSRQADELLAASATRAPSRPKA